MALCSKHAQELERGHPNRATLQVSRKLVAYLMAVDKSGQPFQLRTLPTTKTAMAKKKEKKKGRQQEANSVATSCLDRTLAPPQHSGGGATAISAMDTEDSENTEVSFLRHADLSLDGHLPPVGKKDTQGDASV